MTRLITAAVGLPVLFLLIKVLHPAVFAVVVLCAAAIGTHELHGLARGRGIRPDLLLGIAFTLLAIYTFADDRVSLPAVLATATILVPMRRLLSRDGVDGALESICVTLAGVLVLGIPFGYVVRLMGIGDEMGRDLVVFLFLMIWLADAGAYAVGSWIGRHPLSPTVSPKKSIEGAAGGLVACALGGWLAKAWFFQRLHLHDAIVLSILLWCVGMAGDLAESLLKRSAAVKDTGTLFPGHGGMLDRVDSLLFGAPVLFLYYRAFIA